MSMKKKDDEQLDYRQLINNPPRPIDPVSLTKDSPSTASYPHFTKLPAELQCRIWQFALLDPRTIRLRAEYGHLKIRCRELKHVPTYSHVWAYKIPVPKMLQVCQLSRIIGLQHYSLSFDSNPRPSRKELSEQCQRYTPLRRSGRIWHEESASQSQNLLDGHVLPFEEPALIYVDLKRDIFITTHRQMGFCAQQSEHWSEEGKDLSEFGVSSDFFNIDTFRTVIPRATFEQIGTLVVTFQRGPFQLWPRREAMGMGFFNSRPVLVVEDPFRMKEANVNTGSMSRARSQTVSTARLEHDGIVSPSNELDDGAITEMMEEDYNDEEKKRDLCGNDFINVIRSQRYYMAANKPVIRKGRVRGCFS